MLITIDTLRADHVGCYGYKRGRTPAMDAIAAAGTLFEQASTPTPITLPAHATILTGTYPTLHGLHDFSGNRLDPQQPTLATILAARGYATAAFIGSAVLDRRFGLNSGFQEYFDNFDFSRLLETNLDAMERPGNVVVGRALEWLDRTQHKPFLLWVHLYDPHHPYQPPAPFDSEFKDSPYDGEIAFADTQVARLVEALKKRGLYDRTVLVLSGDHGEGLGEHGEATHGFFIYESTLRVPLIIKPGADLAARRVVTEPVTLADILPTILEALRVAAPHDVQGRSVIPLMRAAGSGRENVYAESFLPRLHFNWSELRGVKAGRYKYIEAPKPELYDLDADPRETKNLFTARPAVAAAMRTRLRTFVDEHTPGQERAHKLSMDPALAERLRSLGYAAVAGGGDPKESGARLPDPKDRIQVYEWVSAAIADSQHGHFEESLAKLSRAAEVEPDAVPILYLMGLNRYRLGRWQEAVRDFRRVLAKSPDYALAVYQLGLAYARLGQIPAAIAQFQDALKLDGTNFSAAFNLGAAYLHERKVAEAEAAFRQAVQINPAYAQARRALGEVLLHEGRTVEGLAELRQAAQLAPEDPAIQDALTRGEAQARAVGERPR